MRGLTGWARRGAVPAVLTVLCVLGTVGAAVADTDGRSDPPEVVLQQSGHWAVDPTAKSVLHVHGGTRQVDARVALPDDAVTDARTALAGGTEGFVVGRDRAWSFDTAALTVTSPVPLPVTDERPVGIEAPGGPYLVYRGRGTLVRLGRPTAVVEAGGPVGPPVTTDDGTVWVHRPDTAALCAFRRGATTLDCAATAPGPGGLTVVRDVATFVDTRADTTTPVPDGAAAPLGADLPDDVLLGDRATSARLPVVEPAVPRLRLLDTTGGAPVDVPLAPGTYSAPLVSGESIAVLELGTSTLTTFTADGAKVAELRLPAGTDATDLHRGEDGRLYVDEPGGARTHVIAPDGTITTIDLAADSTGIAVAGSAPAAIRDTVAPPPPGAPAAPVPVPGPGVQAAPVPGGAPVVGPGGAGTGSGGGSGGGGTAPPPERPQSLLPPVAPVSVKAALTTADRATITWGAGAGGGAPASYTVTRSDGTSATATGRTLVSTGLVVGTSYTFTVTATNDAGTSAASAPSNPVTPAAVATAPGTPKSPTFRFQPDAPRSNTGGTVLAWGAADLNGGTLLYYEAVLNGSEGAVTRTTTGTSIRFANPGDFDVCRPVSYQLRTVTSVDGVETRSKPATFSSSPIRDCATRKSVVRADEQATTVAVGDSVEVRIVVEIGSEPVDSVRATLTFPSDLLACGPIDANGAFDTVTQKSCSGGQVRVAASSSTPLDGGGVAEVARVQLSGVAPGSAALAYGSVTVTGAETGTNTVGSTRGATITVTD